MLIPEDLEAQAFLKLNEKNRLEIVRTRAQSWLSGIAAFTGLVTTVLVVSGPDSVTDLNDVVKYCVAGLLLLALIVLIIANILAYTAAYGSIVSLTGISAHQVVGLHGRLATARRREADCVQKFGGCAIACTLIGTVLLVAVIGITWFSDQETADMCIYRNGTVMRMKSGMDTNFTRLVTVGPCP